MREWLEHYIFHGVEHFYLIDDGSTDNFMDVLEPYIEQGIVEVFHADFKYYLGRQKDMYNAYIFPRLGETQWLIMCDLDEFIWSPRGVDLKVVLRQCEHLGQIQFEHTLFGSSGHIDTPRFAVESYICRSAEVCTQQPGLRKYAINTKWKFRGLAIHHAEFADKADEKRGFILIGPDWIRLNHYNCQSLRFWNEIKCRRGDSDNYKNRTPADFAALDLNEVEDLGLLEQNRELLNKLRCC